ncbi:ABC transporter permease [Xanthobacter versatilis]|uniref:ABC transporter permease n=1 Tax=Xanthobacter autotrophicus (strain ATCC BAA-1158 / Py2) TaxID=78245 RepID=UPI00372AE9C2
MSATLDRAAAARVPLLADGYWAGVWRRLKRDPVTLAVMGGLLVIVLVSVFAPLLTSYGPYEPTAVGRLKPIGTPGHWLGTDDTGRDLWTRLLYGGRLSLLMGVTPVLVALGVGGTIGVVAGLAGGLLNTVIMRTADVFYAFPSVLLAIAICGVFGAGAGSTIIALSIVFTPPLLRVSEGVAAQIRGLDYVAAARASGTGFFQIMRHHVIPNAAPSILVYATSLVSLSIILSSGLSFLGLGVAPPAAEWGLMLNALRQGMYVQPLLAALPGLMIFLTSMFFNLAADGLRGAMDVRLAR